MLAGAQRLLHQGTVGPALRENGDGVDVGRQQLLEARLGAVEPPVLQRRGGALRPFVDDIDLAHSRVELEKVGKVAAELSDADDSDRKRHCLPFLTARRSGHEGPVWAC